MERQGTSAVLPTREFSKVKDNVVTRMDCSREGGRLSLVIHILDYERNEEYRLDVTEEYALTHEQLKRYFEKPEDVFEELMDNFQEIRVEPNGIIEFDVGIGRKKKVTIQL